ncbi:MAG TPA: hypothetical protein VEA63_01760, partial [Opitutus sp.]|nr:hypothetical protein [Opitutus sp.]
MSAASDGIGPHPRSGWVNRFALLIAALALWLASINLPGPPITNLDSWHTILVDARLHDRQFGPEIAFTYGPWGFLSLSGYLPDALAEKFAWEVLGKLTLAITLVLATARVRGGRRWVLLAAFACGLPFFDNSVGVLIPLLALVWLLPRDAAPWQRLLAVLWLALFAHFKFTFCLQALAALLIVTTTACIERRFRDAALVLLASTFAYVGFWIAAGQSLANLPAFCQLSWNLGSGYSWAMSSAPSTAALAAGIFTLAICAAFLRLIWHADLPLTQRLAAAAIALANGFMAWKHGFTRGDHTFAFFFFCLFFGLLLAGLFSRRRGLVWHDLDVLGCLAGIAIAGSGLLLHGPRTALDHWLRFPYELTHLDAWTERFRIALRQTENTAHDPALVAAVGDATVDLINYDQWALLLNGL